MHLRRRIIFAVLSTFFFVGATARPLPDAPGAARTVGMFVQYCFAKMPDIEAIGSFAEKNFQPITGKALDLYRPDAPRGKFKAWKFQDFGTDYVLSASQSDLNDSFKQEMPDFADSQNFACSLHAKNNDAQEKLLEQMKLLMKRPPDRAWDASPLRVYLWSAKTDDILVNVYQYGSLKKRTGGLFSVLVFVKEGS